MKLSILCVTTGKPRSTPFTSDMSWLASELNAEFVCAVDGRDLHSQGYIESVLDEAIAMTCGDYVLRLDDDERCSPAMVRWLRDEDYLSGDHWTFPRVHLWGNSHTFITNPPYFPDFQTRLSVRAKAGNRPVMHQGSPYGAGTIARVCIEHWVYLAKSYEERCATCEFYNKSLPGTGRSIEDEHGPNGTDFMDYSDGLVPLSGRRWRGSLR